LTLPDPWFRLDDFRICRWRARSGHKGVPREPAHAHARADVGVRLVQPGSEVDGVPLPSDKQTACNRAAADYPSPYLKGTTLREAKPSNSVAVGAGNGEALPPSRIKRTTTRRRGDNKKHGPRRESL